MNSDLSTSSPGNMIWTSPEWMPRKPFVPTEMSLGDFALGAVDTSYDEVEKPVLICADGGQSFTVAELKARVEKLAVGLSSLLRWSLDTPRTSWDKVVALYAVNSVDYLTICWAVHRLGGICLLLHSTSTAREIGAHLAQVHCQAFFTSSGLLPIVETAVRDGANVPGKTYLIGSIGALDDAERANQFPVLEHVLKDGESRQSWTHPESWTISPASSQVAFLCPTSGTSGAQKLAKMTHGNVIANVALTTAVEDVAKNGRTEVGLEMLPLSHIYGILISHMMLRRRDTMILHETFDMQKVLKSIAQYRIERLYLVPSIVAALVTNKILFKAFDFSSVSSVTTGGGSLSPELGGKLKSIQPTWDILAGYGTTESGGLATFTGAGDQFLGSSGSLMPTVEAKLANEDGTIVEAYETPGEVLLKSPSVVAGYLDGNEEDLMTPDGWLRTGDVGLFRRGPAGNDHLFIVDRLKDMLKVKGTQVAPADIEETLLRHPKVCEAAVIGEPHELSGERAMAFVVCQPTRMSVEEAAAVKESIREHVERSHMETHWLGNRIVFLEKLPRSSGGKLLKRVLKKGEYAAI